MTTFRARERPHLIFDSEGDATHFINGVGDPCPGGGGGNTGCPVSVAPWRFFHRRTLIVDIRTPWPASGAEVCGWMRRGMAGTTRSRSWCRWALSSPKETCG